MLYEKHDVDKNGWTDWIRPLMKGYKIRCCDCSLVHQFQFKIDGKNVMYRAKRDNRATAASRRPSTKGQ